MDTHIWHYLKSRMMRMRNYIKKYDKFIIENDKMTICFNWNDFESEESFISRVENAIDELDNFPDKIIYTGKEIILVVR